MCAAPKPGHRRGGADGVRERRDDPDAPVAALLEREVLGALVALRDAVPALDGAGRSAPRRRPRVHAQAPAELRVRIGQAARARASAALPTALAARTTTRARTVARSPRGVAVARRARRRRRPSRARRRATTRVASHVGVDARARRDGLRAASTLSAFCFASYAQPSSQKPLCWHPTRLCVSGAPRQPERLARRARSASLFALRMRLGDLATPRGRARWARTPARMSAARAPDDAVLARPQIEDRVGRALAEVRVVHGAAADAAPLQHADGQVLGRAPAHVLEEQREHVVLALVEVGRRGPAAFFERDRVEPGARQLAQRDRAARARADDDGVDVEREVAREVAAAERSRRSSPPLARPTHERPVVAEDRPRARVAVVAHEDERLEPVEAAAQQIARRRLERREHAVLIVRRRGA